VVRRPRCRAAPGRRAAALDCARRVVTLDGGHALGYEQLLIATGSRPRRLALLDGFANVHALRTVDDARALRVALAGGGRLVIVGAGFIGQEVAAAAVKAGVHTTLVELADAPPTETAKPSHRRSSRSATSPRSSAPAPTISCSRPRRPARRSRSS
jgi:p-cumate 2,3-dioxygenase ferredoxin reductase component